MRRLIFLWPWLLYKCCAINSPGHCGDACKSVVSGLTFTGISPLSDYYGSLCTNTLSVQSTFLCMKHYCTESEIDATLEDLGCSCEQYGAVSLLPWSIISNISDAKYLEYPHIGADDLASTTTYTTPVFVEKPVHTLALRTIV